jgi:hypothetical protein
VPCALNLYITQIRLVLKGVTLSTTVEGKPTDPFKNNESLPLHCLNISPGRRLLRVRFVISQNSNFHIALTTQSRTEKNCIISHSQDTTALQSNMLLTGVHR